MNENKSCIDCGYANCNKMDRSYNNFCMTTHMDEEALMEAMECYSEGSEDLRVAKAAAEVESENYCKMTRVEEIMEFAKKLQITKIGIAPVSGCCRKPVQRLKFSGPTVLKFSASDVKQGLCLKLLWVFQSAVKM